MGEENIKEHPIVQEVWNLLLKQLKIKPVSVKPAACICYGIALQPIS